MSVRRYTPRPGAPTAQDHVRDAQSALQTGLAGLTTTDGWRAFLDARASLDCLSVGRLSVGNQLSALVQGALMGTDATQVATFATWKRYGRFPRAGSKALWILQPRPFVRRTEGTDPATGEDTTAETRGMAFRPLAVFAFGQTDGDALPAVTAPPTGEVSDATFAALVAFAGTVAPGGVDLRDAEDSAGGWYDRRTRGIVVMAHGKSRAEIFAVLAHECAHAILHSDEEQHSRPVKEVEAESVAYIVSRAAGIATDAGSLCYVSSWGGDDPKTAARIALQCAERIASAAARIIEALELDAAEETDVNAEAA